jgi:hypothetical protein
VRTRRGQGMARPDAGRGASDVAAGPGPDR